MKEPSPAVTAGLGAAAVVLILAALAAIVVVDFGDDSPSGGSASSPAPSNSSQGSGTTLPAGPPQPINDACSLVTVDSVAAAIGAKPADVKPEPGTQTTGPKCDFRAPQDEDILIGFTVQLTEAGGDPAFARSTIEARPGKRIGDLGDVAVLEQSDVGSRISVVRGSRYVQLQTQRKPASDDAMIGLARQAVAKL